MVRPFTQRVGERIKCGTMAFIAMWCWESMRTRDDRESRKEAQPLAVPESGEEGRVTGTEGV